MQSATTKASACRAPPLRMERDRWYVVLGLVDCSIALSEPPHSSRQSFQTSLGKPGQDDWFLRQLGRHARNPCLTATSQV